MQYDAIVVGGSFAGISAATYIARARQKVLVIDAGKPRNRFAEASHGFFGHDGNVPAAMIANARAQLLSYPNVTFVAGEAVSAARDPNGFEITLDTGQSAHATRIVLATGVVDELPDFPGLRERWGKTVIHCPYCHGFEFNGAPLGVLATSPMSLHQAELVPDWGPVTFFTNEVIDLDNAARAQLARRRVVIEPEKVAGLEGAAPNLTGVRLENGRVVPVAALFVGAPIRMASPLAHQLGCAFDETPMGSIIRTGPDKQTSVPGVYAAGDAARVPHSVAWAVADGVTAGVSLHRASVTQAVAA